MHQHSIGSHVHGMAHTHGITNSQPTTSYCRGSNTADLTIWKADTPTDGSSQSSTGAATGNTGSGGDVTDRNVTAAVWDATGGTGSVAPVGDLLDHDGPYPTGEGGGTDTDNCPPWKAGYWIKKVRMVWLGS